MQEAKRLHPLLIVAAVSLTAFSAVGIAALTGFLPNSRGANEDFDTTKAVARPVAAEAAPVPVAAASAPAAPAVEPAVPAATPAAPAPAMKKSAVHRKPVKIVAKNDVAEPAAAAPAPSATLPPPPIAQTPPQPAPLPGIAGVVESVREVTQPGQGNGLGAAAGGLLGGIFGSQMGHGSGRTLMTVLGAAGGALAGHTIQKDATATKRWEVTVRLDDGSVKTLPSDSLPYWHPGDHVRYLDGRLQPAA